MRSTALVILLLLLVACDDKPKGDGEAKADGPANADDGADAKSAPPDKAEPEPTPLPPAPDGAVELDGKYVSTCSEDHPCPKLVHAQGKAHCEGRKDGELTWRLPTLAELESWRGKEGLTAYDVMHWSGSVWEQDAGQIWIYDPGSGAKTTAPPDRKPFSIRCVAEPR